MTTASERRILDALGDPVEARRRLHGYRQTASALASMDLLARYPEEWVAAYDGMLVGHSSDLPALLRSLTERGIPRRDALIRYISKDEPEFFV